VRHIESELVGMLRRYESMEPTPEYVPCGTAHAASNVEMHSLVERMRRDAREFIAKLKAQEEPPAHSVDAAAECDSYDRWHREEYERMERQVEELEQSVEKLRAYNRAGAEANMRLINEHRRLRSAIARLEEA